MPRFPPSDSGHILSKSHPATREPNSIKQTFFPSKDVDILYAYFTTPIFHCLKWSVCPCGFVHDIFVTLCVQLQNKVRVVGGSIHTEYIALCPTHMTECCLLKKKKVIGPSLLWYT